MTVEVGLGTLVGTGGVIVITPTELQQGAVILHISKVSNDLRVSWEINTVDFPALTGAEKVEIYYLAFDSGEIGQYNKTSFSQLVIDNNNLAAGAPTGTALDGTRAFKWSSQAGMGYTELYFIACINDLPTHPDYGLAKAVAVGKVDQDMTTDYNFVSMPMYMVGGAAISQAFSAQFDIDGTELYSFDEASGNLTKAKYQSGWAFSPAVPFDIQQGKSYWVRLGAAKRISLLGYVSNVSFSKAMFGTRYLVLGNAFPLLRNFDTVLPAAGTNELYLFHNDTKLLEKLKNSGGTWINAAPGEPVYKFLPGSGYWYRNQGSDSTWTLTSP
jgi:hypothetical protein